ncbi:hypothetical protein M3T53_04515 [Actinomyces sp. B33]|uniref:hypothetical protein n=1 Tax=Actinomyces sp. B33 TaxID=2942131 RepID=UPI0023413B4E|nr:hypothetical protein [Actinomyces sp. B33]MDC4232975.1 hypothetical protein [Actinomyces sp. B33]
MGQWGGVVMLELTGLGILCAWAWLWAGPTPRTRRIAIERLYPQSPRAAAPAIQQIVWPLIPLVGVAWLVVGLLVARIVQGRDCLVETSLVVACFGLVAACALWTAIAGPLPSWCYPGWRAERHYLTHPELVDRELGARAAARFLRLHRLAPSA